MKTHFSSMMTVAALATVVAGCSSDGGLLGSSLTTSSVDAAKVALGPKVDPACVALTAKIDALRKDGVTERVEKAAAGKTQNVSVKRESLAKMTELDKANADFQNKCAVAGLAKPVIAAPVAAAVLPAASTNNAAAALIKPVAAKSVAKTAAVVAPAAVNAVAPAVPATAPAAVAVIPAAVAVTPTAVAVTPAAIAVTPAAVAASKP